MTKRGVSGAGTPETEAYLIGSNIYTNIVDR